MYNEKSKKLILIKWIYFKLQKTITTRTFEVLWVD